tara:strand:- start:4 stop:804 length:801 start_codon:yes stop_codon:yes gene_type:complete
MSEENIYTTNDKGFAGKIGEEFSENYLYPINNKNNKNNKKAVPPPPEENINIFDNNNNQDVKLNVKQKGRPPKNCIQKLNENEFKDKNFIQDDFLYNKKSIFNTEHYNQCNLTFLREIYFKLKQQPYKNSSFPLDSKKFLIEGRHDEKYDVQGILELQKANLSDSLSPENNSSKKYTIDDDIDTVYPELDFKELKNSITSEPSENNEEDYKDTNVDKIILYNKDIKIPDVKNTTTTNSSEFNDYNEYLLYLEKKSYEYNKDNKYSL